MTPEWQHKSLTQPPTETMQAERAYGDAGLQDAAPVIMIAR